MLFSCNTGKSKEEREKKEKEMKEMEKQTAINRLGSKYDIRYNLDTIHFRFSIDYDRILESKYQLINVFYVKDIFQKDSAFFVSIRIQGKFTFTFPITENQLKLFTENDLDNILVIDIKEIEKNDTVLNRSAKGELIEIVSLKK
jgi:hypothetical protein